MSVPVAQPCQFILNGSPRGWRERYDERAYLLIDPVVKTAAKSVLPFFWEDLDRSSPPVRRLFEEAASYGLKYGLGAPAHGPHGESGLFCLAKTDRLPEERGARAQLLVCAQWFSALVLARLSILVPVLTTATDCARQQLTARERDCLRLAAEGFSAQAIGKKMRITERTVVFHLGRCGQKLGARSRQHAVARAVALGEIDVNCFPQELQRSAGLVDFPPS